jgi:hypothetical protein
VPPPTDQEIALKLVNDPKYFIERSFSIVNQSSQEVPFLFNPAQAHFYENKTQRDIIVKARKEGFSSLIDAIIAHACGTQMHTRAAIISHTDEGTGILLDKVKFFIETSKIRFKTSRSNDNEIFFPDTKSVLYAGTAGSKSYGRGSDLTILHLSESAHYADDKMITGIQEAMVKGRPTWIVEETTSLGAGTPFHQRWLRAINQKSGWKPHFYGWFWDRLNQIAGAKPMALTDEEKSLKETFNLSWEQIAWRRWKLEEMADPTLFPQENPATWEESFLSAGGMVFDWRAIKKQEDNIQKPKWVGHIMDRGGSIDIMPDPKGPMQIFLTPSDRTRYIVVCDSALGIPGKDYSVADVYDMRTWEQVAQWRGHAAPLEFADIAMRIGAFYGWALLAGENNYPGNAVVQAWSTSSYPNLWDEPEETGDEIGWKTTDKSKNQIVSDAREALRDVSIKLNSIYTINELRTFIVKDNGKFAAQEGCHDDTVITFSKATNLLKRMHYEPEEKKKSFHEIMGFKRRPSGQSIGGHYNTGVV